MSEKVYRLGEYVRSSTQDMGTGVVMAHAHVERIALPSRLVEEIDEYQVAWLDQEGAPVRGPYQAKDLKPSARALPTFSSPEEAEEWIAQRNGTGNWLDQVDDFAASTADSIEQEIKEAVASVVVVTCGSEQCGCGDCLTDSGMHINGFGCKCEEKHCGCLHQDA